MNKSEQEKYKHVFLISLKQRTAALSFGSAFFSFQHSEFHINCNNNWAAGLLWGHSIIYIVIGGWEKKIFQVLGPQAMHLVYFFLTTIGLNGEQIEVLYMFRIIAILSITSYSGILFIQTSGEHFRGGYSLMYFCVPVTLMDIMSHCVSVERRELSAQVWGNPGLPVQRLWVN